MFDGESIEAQSAAFRRHRHDVLNELQVLRAYLQMGQPDRAIGIVDRTAEWLQSLTRWQTDGGEHGVHLMWSAATCPNICLCSIAIVDKFSPGVAKELQDWLNMSNEQLAQSGIRMQIALRVEEACCVVRVLTQEALQFVQVWDEKFAILRFVNALGEKITN